MRVRIRNMLQLVMNLLDNIKIFGRVLAEEFIKTFTNQADDHCEVQSNEREVC